MNDLPSQDADLALTALSRVADVSHVGMDAKGYVEKRFPGSLMPTGFSEPVY